MFRVECPVEGCDYVVQEDDFDLLADLLLFHHEFDHHKACVEGDQIGRGWTVEVATEVTT